MSDRDHTSRGDAAPDELVELRALAAEVGAEPTTWLEPPAGLWERIAAEAGVSPDEVEASPDGADASDRLDVRPDGDAPAPAVVPIDRGRPSGRHRVLPWLVAAAAVVLVAVGIGLVATRTSEPTVVATAPLERLGDAGEGSAVLLDDDGTYRLRVDTADLDAGDGFLEVWVIDEGVTKLVSLGPLRPDGTYDLPDSVDPRQFPVVDVSVEPVDGDPAHSGDSVLRGTLQF
jgi:hypothetical protein